MKWAQKYNRTIVAWYLEVTAKNLFKFESYVMNQFWDIRVIQFKEKYRIQLELAVD
jgi:hypothetical protein